MHKDSSNIGHSGTAHAHHWVCKMIYEICLLAMYYYNLRMLFMWFVDLEQY